MNQIQEFYNQIQFPGHYSYTSLALQAECLTNPYLRFIDRHLGEGLEVLDAGCGTGLISNLFAQRYTQSTFTGVDFADSIDYARLFANQHNITNVKFERADLTHYKSKNQYDVVICQGVLHHIPDSQRAIECLQNLVRPDGTLILGLYHPWGKILKKFCAIDYGNSTLFQDQENNPYETTYTPKEVKRLFKNFEFVTAYPYLLNTFIAIPSLLNYRNGGLVTYILKKSS